MLDKSVQNHLGRQLRALYDGVRAERRERAAGASGSAQPGEAKPRPTMTVPDRVWSSF